MSGAETAVRAPFRGMDGVRVVNRTRASVVGEAVAVADRRWTRLRGYLGRGEPRAGEGILIEPCKGVHMMGMRYALDVVFVDAEGRVVALCEGLAPWRRSPVVRRARCALEVPPGTIRRTGTRVGDLLEREP